MNGVLFFILVDILLFILLYLIIGALFALVTFILFCNQYKKERKGGYNITFDEWSHRNDLKNICGAVLLTWPYFIICAIVDLIVKIIKKAFKIEE